MWRNAICAAVALGFLSVGQAQAQGDGLYGPGAAGGAQGMDPALADQFGSPNQVYTMRGLTLTPGTLRIDVAPPDRALRNFGQGLRFTKFQGFSDLFVDLSIGAAFGVIENLEVGAVVLPLGFAPSGRDAYQNPDIYARYRFLDGCVELAGQVSVNLPVLSGSDFGLTLALPARFQLGQGMHINTGVALPILFASDAVVGLNIPFEFAVNVSPEIFLGANTGFTTRLTQSAFDPGTFPLGVFGGYTVALSPTMALDLQGGFQWTNFLGFGDARGDAIDAETFQITVGANLHADIIAPGGA